MLRTGLLTLLRRTCASPLTAAVMLAGRCAPALADSAQPPLTAQAARTAIAGVLATSKMVDGPGFANALQASGVVALLAGAIVLAMVLKRRAATQSPIEYWTLPPSRPDILALQQAQAMWRQSPVLAVGRLYQGLLARLATDYQLIVPEGDTEPELVQRVAALRLSGLDDFARRLAGHWERSRYAGKAPSDAEWAALCAGWRRLFPDDVST